MMLGSRLTPVRIVIADDHGLVRQGFRSMLTPEEGFEVVGEAADGREAVELCSRLRPQLVLMDVRMPRMDGLAATRQIKQRFPETSVLIVTMQENPDDLLEAVKTGAAGYVLKGSPNSQIRNDVRRVLDGKSPLNQELAMYVIHNLTGTIQGTASSPDPRSHEHPLPYSLTKRELEVLRLLSRGQTNQQIAKTWW